jgi:hypothetical protein
VGYRRRMYSNIGGKQYKIYKSICRVSRWIQFSFASDPSQPYYYINSWDKQDQWSFHQSYWIRWEQSWLASVACESNWLEILVVSGWTQERIETEIEQRDSQRRRIEGIR